MANCPHLSSRTKTEIVQIGKEEITYSTEICNNCNQTLQTVEVNRRPIR